MDIGYVWGQETNNYCRLSLRESSATFAERKATIPTCEQLVFETIAAFLGVGQEILGSPRDGNATPRSVDQQHLHLVVIATFPLATDLAKSVRTQLELLAQAFEDWRGSFVLLFGCDRASDKVRPLAL